MDPLRADAGGHPREPRRCRGTGRSTPRRLNQQISGSCYHVCLWKWNDFCVQTFDSAFVWSKNIKRWPWVRFIVRGPRPEALTFACKKQNHNECFCFYPGISERAKLSAYYAQPNIKPWIPKIKERKQFLHKKVKLFFCIIFMTVEHILK